MPCMLKRTTIKDIARKTGYSPSTVSKALNDQSCLPESTRRGIQQAASDMGYLPNRAARGLRGGLTQSVGILMPGFPGQFYVELFAALAEGRATVPVRLNLETEHGVTLFMPAHLRDFGPDGEAAGAKVVAVNPGNADAGLPVIHAVVLGIDPVTGQTRALMDGTWLTALRTGAVGGLAADLLARTDARVVALFGAGVQARTQLDAVRCVRDITEVRVVSPSGTR